MLRAIISAVLVSLIEWIGDRFAEPDTGRAAGRDDALRDRIRRRVREHEDGVRRRRGTDPDRS